MQNVIEIIKKSFQTVIEKVKGFLTKPKETWEGILNEEATIGGLFKNYMLVLAAVPALATFLGRMLVGYRMPFMDGVVTLSFSKALVSSIVQYAMTVGSVWILAKVVHFLAPRFGTEQDELKCFKLSVYSYTPYLAASVLLLFPSLGILVSIAGLYTLYLIYLGLPILLGTPKEKALPYTVVIIVAVILISIIISAISGAMLRSFGPAIYFG